MNKRMILVTPEEAEYADRYLALSCYVEQALYTLPAKLRSDRLDVAMYLLEAFDVYIRKSYPVEYDCV